MYGYFKSGEIISYKIIFRDIRVKPGPFFGVKIPKGTTWPNCAILHIEFSIKLHLDTDFLLNVRKSSTKVHHWIEGYHETVEQIYRRLK